MFSTKWETSKRQYDIIHERNVAILVRAGFNLDYDILRPDSTEKFPAILCLLPFYKEDQIKSIMPVVVCPELEHPSRKIILAIPKSGRSQHPLSNDLVKSGQYLGAKAKQLGLPTGHYAEVFFPDGGLASGSPAIGASWNGSSVNQAIQVFFRGQLDVPDSEDFFPASRCDIIG